MRSGASTSQMLRIVQAAVALLVMQALLGCAGSIFERPSDHTFALGSTTYAQVIARMGTSATIFELTSPRGCLTKDVRYRYSSRFGRTKEQDSVPSRIQIYVFCDDVLVARDFTSSFEEDSTDFDESKIKGLVKGKTTRAQVIEIFGRPTGAYIWPYVPKVSGELIEAIGYHYSYIVKHDSPTGPRTYLHNKHLIVSFDRNDRVVDITYQKRDDE